MGKKSTRWDTLKSLRDKNMGFNPRPFSSSIDPSSEKIDVAEDISFVDLHLEVTRKVDALIAELEQETVIEEWELVPEEKIVSAPENIIQQ